MKPKVRFYKLTAWLLTLAMLMTFIPSFTITSLAADVENANENETIIDLSQCREGDTIFISEDCKIIGDGIIYDVTLHISEDATVIFDVGTSGVKLNGQITVADGKTLTLLVAGDAEHIVNGGISLGNGSNVIIEGDLDKPNNKLTVTATDGNAGIGANNGVTAGDITIRNARVDATGSSKELSAESGLCAVDTSISGAAIGTSYGSMGDILIENSIIVAEGGYYEDTSHAAAIGIGFVSSTMGNITLKDSQITARNNGDGLASAIGAGANHHVYVSGTMGDIIIKNTDLDLSMAIGTKNCYAAMMGSGIGFTHCYVNMGKIIFTDVTQAELDEMIANWLPSDFNEWGAYALGRGYDGSIYQYDAFGGVYVSDGNDGIVQIGNDDGYYISCNRGSFEHEYDNECDVDCNDCEVTRLVYHTPDENGYTNISDSSHSFTCSVCEENITMDHTVNNKVGQTCMGKKCTQCKTWYGEVADHNWVDGGCTYGCDTEHTPHDWNDKNGTCKTCGYVCDHVGENATDDNGICDVCGEVLETIIVKYDKDTQSAIVTVKEADTYSLIFAKYGENNRLDKINIVKFTFEKGENTVPQEIKDFTLGTGDKIMLWQDMTNLVPLCEAYIVK